MYNNCLDTGQGPWCPTKVKTKTVDTWAYCDLKPKSLSLKNRIDNSNASKTNSVNSKNKRSVKKKISTTKTKKIDISKFVKNGKIMLKINKV